jgi:hypothetical protein
MAAARPITAPTAPCAAFARAIQQTGASEIDCLSSGFYGALNSSTVPITGSITIDCGEGNVGRVAANGGSLAAITINTSSVVRGERNEVFRTRQSSLDVHLPWLDEQWASDCRNGAELWRRLTARGFPRIAARRRRMGNAQTTGRKGRSRKPPTHKTAAGLTSWIERARASPVASFGNGVVKDKAAVRAAIKAFATLLQPAIPRFSPDATPFE